MGRRAVSEGDETKVISVRVGLADLERVRAAARAYGKPVGEFARLAVLAATRGALEPSMTITSANNNPERSGFTVPRDRKRVSTIVGSGTGHEHVAGKMLSGGIHPCIEKGCMARKINGSWVEVI